MRKYFLLVLFAGASFGPMLVNADLIQNCSSPLQCNYSVLIDTINKFISYAIFLTFPIVAVIFAYAGWLLLTDQGSASNISKAWDLIKDAGTGFAIMLLAWVFVRFILSKLLSGGFSATFNNMFNSTRY